MGVAAAPAAGPYPGYPGYPGYLAYGGVPAGPYPPPVQAYPSQPGGYPPGSYPGWRPWRAAGGSGPIQGWGSLTFPVKRMAKESERMAKES